ncbi:MAG: class I SAM-dependent methyltransferase [Rhizobiaceae bacterium]
MKKAIRDPGSFRDSGAYIFSQDNRIFRGITPAGMDQYAELTESNILDLLCDKGLMIESRCIDFAPEDMIGFTGARGEMPSVILEHPRIPLITYPYEWTFLQLKDAALAHLQLQLTGLEHGYVFSDATAYNMQFHEGGPVHIDVMSLKKYRDGQPWDGYNQFCREFLIPLLIESWAGLSFQSLYRGSLNGIGFDEALKILPRRKLLFSVTGLLHVYLHGKRVLSKTAVSQDHSQKSIDLPKNRYKAILMQLQEFISGLSSGRNKSSYWKDYAKTNSYDEESRQKKMEFVRGWAGAEKPGRIWDIGGNTGDYALAAIEAGAGQAIVVDGDIDSLEMAYETRFKAGKPVMPLVMDLLNPTPNLGWKQTERRGLQERIDADGVIALALIHHLAIGGNIPLSDAVNWLLSFAPKGVIEFVPKSDPMVKGLLNFRDDIFTDYDEETFLKTISATRNVNDTLRLSEGGRLLISYGSK